MPIREPIVQHFPSRMIVQSASILFNHSDVVSAKEWASSSACYISPWILLLSYRNPVPLYIDTSFDGKSMDKITYIKAGHSNVQNV